MRHTFKHCPRCATPLIQAFIDGRKRYTCKKCNWIHYKNPLPIALCAAKDSKGRILLVKRGASPGINQWALPGGFIEWRESPEAGCLRELKEETGIRGSIKRLIGAYLRNTKTYGSLIVLGFEAKALTNKIRISDEIKAAGFFFKSDLPYIPFAPHRKIIKEVLG